MLLLTQTWRRLLNKHRGYLAAAAGAVLLLSQQSRAADAFDVVRLLAKVLVLVEEQYVEPVDRKRLLSGALKGMVAELDPHSAYLSAEDFAQLQADTNGEFAGVGVEVDFRGGEVTVLATIDGSPAERAGIKSGDKVIAVDNQSVGGQSAEQLIRRLRGAAGTKVQIKLQRAGEVPFREFTLKRELIEVASVTSKRLMGDVGYLRIRQFQRGTHQELLSAIAQLRRGNAPLRAVILDLRNNPGGLVVEAVALADEFLSSGGIYETRHRNVRVDQVAARRGGAVTEEPLVVLINSYSASAAELVAGALKDNKRGTIVGARSFGKGSVQTLIDLPNGGGLKLTTLRYYTPQGHAIQARGVTPDIAVATADPPSVEPQLSERDLENHLAEEGDSKELPSKQVLFPRSSSEESPERAETREGVAVNVPDNPRHGIDHALDIGYAIVRGEVSVP